MITLATLKDATAQQVFDQVAAHLLKQNAQSRSEDGWRCLYRGDKGMMCAAGCLIGDDEYKPFFDQGQSAGGGSWAGMVNRGTIPGDHKELIGSLQKLHDCESPLSFKSALKRLADENGLVFDAS